ncbi:MAG: transporter family protein [Bacillales bacterium]|nr:transporter family protein [Bacillales bacterium]
MSKIIEVNNLSKDYKITSSRSGLSGAFRDLFSRNYKHVTAVNDVSFHINRGEIVGYIGENGAGKSTTIKMLTGILTPSSGSIVINGMDPHKNREEYVKSIGVVFGQRSQLWWDIAVQESFRLLKKIYKVNDADYKRNMDLINSTLEIEGFLDQPVRKLSLGQRMRCELAAALIHNPQILFLDEPTIGLDVLVKMKIREFLKEINKEYKTTILLTTHDISDIEALCERVIMLDEGKIIYNGELESLRTSYAEGKEIVFEFKEKKAKAALEAATSSLPVTWSHLENDLKWIAKVHKNEISISDVMAAIVEKHEILDLKVREVALEEVIRKIYEEGIRNGQVS